MDARHPSKLSMCYRRHHVDALLTLGQRCVISYLIVTILLRKIIKKL